MSTYSNGEESGWFSDVQASRSSRLRFPVRDSMVEPEKPSDKLAA